MQRVPGHRADNRKRPTNELAATMSWNDELVAADRVKTLTAGNTQSRCALCSSPPGNAAPCFKDTEGWSFQAYAGYIQKRPASAAQSDVTASGHGRTSHYH